MGQEDRSHGKRKQVLWPNSKVKGEQTLPTFFVLWESHDMPKSLVARFSCDCSHFVISFQQLCSWPSYIFPSNIYTEDLCFFTNKEALHPPVRNMNLLPLDIDFLIVNWISNLGHNAMIPFIIKILKLCQNFLKSTHRDQNLNNLEGDQDTSACQISGHCSKVFSIKCLEFPNLTCFTELKIVPKIKKMTVTKT